VAVVPLLAYSASLGVCEHPSRVTAHGVSSATHAYPLRRGRRARGRAANAATRANAILQRRFHPAVEAALAKDDGKQALNEKLRPREATTPAWNNQGSGEEGTHLV
jgi:hypothetical protein